MPGSFSITRDLEAAPERVFDVLTQLEYFSQWFGTRNLVVPRDTLVMEVRPGGEFKAQMLLPDGGHIDWAGTFVEVDRPHRLGMTLTDSPGDDPGVPVLFELAPADTGSTLTIRQDRGDFSDEQVAATVAGYNSFIDDMESILADMP